MFSDIEAKRARAGIPQKELCERAGVHPTRYTARKSGRSGLSERTLKKLEDALEELLRERGIIISDAPESDQ